MIEKIFNKKYIDLSKIVSMELDSVYDTNTIDCIKFDIQLIDKPLVIECPKANLRSSTSEENENSTKEEFERILLLWKSINKPVETTNEQPIDKAFRKLKEENYYKICISAKICPKCGGNIIPFLNGHKKSDYKTGYHYVACENDSTHYNSNS